MAIYAKFLAEVDSWVEGKMDVASNADLEGCMTPPQTYL